MKTGNVKNIVGFDKLISDCNYVSKCFSIVLELAAVISDAAHRDLFRF